MSDADHGGGPSQEKQKRPRRRPQLSCVLCKRRKVKCNRELPCDQCYKLSKGRGCTYTDIFPSPDNSDESILTSDLPRNTVHRASAESNTGARRWTQSYTPPALNDRPVSSSLANRDRDAYPATPGDSPAQYGSGGPARDASAETPVSTPHHFVGAQVNGNAEPSISFLGDPWITELHGNSHWWTVFPKVRHRTKWFQLTITNPGSFRPSPL